MAQKIASSNIQSTASVAADTVSTDAISVDAISIEACGQMIPIESVQKILNRAPQYIVTPIPTPKFSIRLLNLNA